MEKIKISKKKNEVLVNLNRQFYNEGSIKQAVLDFKDICSVEEKKEKILLKPKQSKDIDLLGYEFYNHVLGLMKNR